MASENGIVNNEPAILISRLQNLTSRLCNDKDDEARKDCLQLSKALTAQLEPPENTALDMAFSPMIAVSVRIAVDLNLFEHIVQKGSVTSASGRAVRCGRIVDKTWTATHITKAMATKGIAAGHRVISQFAVPAMQSAPAFFLQRGPSCPVDPKDGLMQLAFETGQTAYELIASDPAMLKDFNIFMGNSTGARRFWVDWYPVQSRILDGATSDKSLIVDVGGGKGHDLLEFNSKFPNTGRLVLEDLEAVTEGLGELGTSIEKVAYDFFTEQPVLGARVYFYHHILHDWSDRYCLQILKRVAAAMTPGYTKLLIHEMIVPEQGASLFQAQLDIAMMAFNGGMERTREQWRMLLEKAGLRVVEYWEPMDDGGDGIVEAERC